MGTEVQVQLIGDFRVTIGGTDVDAGDFERRSGVELIQVLALVPERRLHREQVVDRLWPDADLDAAANRLHKAASFARKALGSSDAVVLRGDMVSLLPDQIVTTDIDRLEAVDANDAAAVRHLLDQTVGEVLADVPYAEWAAEPRRRVHARRLRLLTSARRWSDLIALDPANEAAHLGLMQEAIDRGDRDAALNLYEQLTRALESELGVPPSEAAENLRARAAEEPAAHSNQPALRVTFLIRITDPSTDAEPLFDRCRTLITAAHGRTASTGPSTLGALFPTVADAVDCSIDCQLAAQSEHANGTGVCIAIDVGEVRVDESNWNGAGTERVHRIAEAGSNDQILCTAPIADLIRREQQGSARALDLGRFRLPGLAPTSLYRVVDARVDHRQTPLRVARVTGNIVDRSATVTVGRDAEIADTTVLLRQHRIVTVTGPGGAGKTHLAKYVGNALGTDYAGGVWFCELGGVADAAGAQHETLAAIGSQHHADATVLESIVRSIGDRPTLLILDNCEHVLEGAGEIVDAVLLECPAATILATSRIPLDASGEVIRPIGPLSRAAARQLFINAADRVGADLDPADPGIERICAQLDDLPLAVQLAAARSRTLDVATIEHLLGDRLRNLRASGPAEVPHHQTLRASIAWSVDALDPELRAVLVDLTSFANRFDMPAAMEVAARPGADPVDVVDNIAELTRRSLLLGPTQVDGRATYRLLESVRIYAAELAEERHAEERHAQCYLARVETADALMGSQPAEAVRRIRADWDDLRVAVHHLHRNNRFRDVTRLLGSLGQFVNITQGFELLEWCELTLEPTPEVVTSVAHARSLASWASLRAQHGDGDSALRLASIAHEAYPDDTVVLWALVYGPWTLGDLDAAHHWLEVLIDMPEGAESMSRPGTLLWLTMLGWSEGHDIAAFVHELEVLATDNDPVHQAVATLARGIQQILTDPNASVRALDRCIAICDDHDVGFVAITARSIRALSVTLMGGEQDALEGVLDSLTWSSDRGMWAWSLATLATAASVFQRCGRHDMATTVLAARRACGYDGGVGGALVDAQIEGLEQHFPEDFDAWWEAGQRLDAPKASELAIAVVTELLEHAKT